MAAAVPFTLTEAVGGDEEVPLAGLEMDGAVIAVESACSTMAFGFARFRFGLGSEGSDTMADIFALVEGVMITRRKEEIYALSQRGL